MDYKWSVMNYNGKRRYQTSRKFICFYQISIKFGGIYRKSHLQIIQIGWVKKMNGRL